MLAQAVIDRSCETQVVERVTAIKNGWKIFLFTLTSEPHLRQEQDLFFLKGPCILTDAECIHPKR